MFAPLSRGLPSRTRIPGRLDRLPWSRWHWLVVIGLGILPVRRNVPESPRWLFIHGRNDQAEELVADIERQVEEETGQRLEEVTDSIGIRQRRSIGFGVIAHTAFKLYPHRTVLGLALFVGQAFLHNAVFFTQALVLSTFFGVADDVVPAYLIPFAFGTCSGRC